MVAETFSEINIHDFRLEKSTLIACPPEYLDVAISDIEFKDDDSFHSQMKCENITFPFAKSGIFKAKVLAGKTLVEGEDLKKVIEITINVEDNEPFEFAPGDTIGILPQNCDEDVDNIMESLQLGSKSDQLCNISLKSNTIKKGVKIPNYIPLKSTPRKIIKDCLNVRSVPKKLLLRALIDYTNDDDEKEFLKAISSKEGSHLYTKAIVENSLTFLDILKLCSSCHPPLQLLIEHLPRLLPRAYSISNSPLVNKNELKIIFSILPTNPGVTTKMLEGIADKYFENYSSSVNMYLRQPNSFRYTHEDFSKNIIMISVGCAISPFIGFLQHKSELCKDSVLGNPGIAWLFAGFRTQNCTLYRRELEEFQKMGVLNDFYVSYSRDCECRFRHVQDQMLENSEEFIDLLLQDTILFVCADGAEISKQITNCVKDCLRKVQNISDEEAQSIVVEFKKSGKYREDIWT